MVETSRRSRRNTDENVGMPKEDASDSSLSDEGQSRRRSRRKRPDLVPCPPGNTPAASSARVHQLPPESHFSSSRLAEKQQRRHSFRIPDLPSIKSSETEEDSDLSSLARTPSAESDPARRTGSRKRKKTYPIATRESEDERYQGYLLTLAASAADKQLREQAMAAYPNENKFDQADHYGLDADSEPESDTQVHMGKLAVEDSDDDRAKSGSHRTQRQRHRDSGTGWDAAEMRSHQAQLDDQRQRAWLAGQEMRQDKQSEIYTRGKSPQGAPSPPQHIVGWQKDNESAAMRKAAAPPMGGKDLKFAKCLSPRQTRIDPHQYPVGAKRSTPAQSREPTGLWTPGSGPSRKSSRSGLWMGVNALSAQPAVQPPGAITGLITPARERSEYFSSSQAVSRSTSPLSRKGSRASKAGLAMTSVISSPVAEQAPAVCLPTPPASVRPGQQPTTRRRSSAPVPSEEDLEREFPDSFVTQVYNYLSLGYPVLARPYDDELSRITRTHLSALRKDDENAAPALNLHTSPKPAHSSLPSVPTPPVDKTGYARGYVGVPEGTGADARTLSPSHEPGERWKALRLYVWEWGRQQRGIWEEDVDEDQAGGACARDVDEEGEEQWRKKGVGLGIGVGWGGAGGGGRKSSWGW